MLLMARTQTLLLACTSIFSIWTLNAVLGWCCSVSGPSWVSK